jgi:hypothetical protein
MRLGKRGKEEKRKGGTFSAFEKTRDAALLIFRRREIAFK